MDIINLRKNIFFVGRASTAIYLILKTLMKNKEVILPSNICYAAVYPVIYSDNIPVFVDISKKTGNTTFENIKEKINKNTGAIIFPYMYGNVEEDIFKIKEYCKKNKIILIEDCASAMGAKVCNQKIGTIGDYSVFSTGHAKILDLGNGGFLVTDENIDKIKKEYDKLEEYSKSIEKKIEDFSREYRGLRNEGNNKKIRKFFQKQYRELFLYKLNENFINKIKNEIENLDKISRDHQKKYEIFENNINKNEKIEVIKYQKGSNPWRFNILIKNAHERKYLIRKLVENKLFVSDWYPCIGKTFSNKKYPNCDEMEKEILNFSLTDSEENIKKICEIINEYFKRSNLN